MTDGDTPKQPKPKGNPREDRLKQALKANLARRKAQARGRGEGKAAVKKGDDA
ncbi:hypothetical protein [Roseovarius dicentrarchi]|uniref:hypothetical protein n=1 Tax=Roseovarius dicentrarchi TaxID=2250573 RepID=UPI00193A6A67|nr:hypothetical protein [Roseovarius dicentrarchi]